MESREVKCLNSRDPVIMVDDNAIDVEITRRVYARSSLSNPFVAFYGGEVFLEYMEEVEEGARNMPAIVLLDINMPTMNGFEVLAALRRLERFREVPPVVMLSNSDDPDDKRRAIESGANEFQTKHFDVDRYVSFFNDLAPGSR